MNRRNRRNVRVDAQILDPCHRGTEIAADRIEEGITTVSQDQDLVREDEADRARNRMKMHEQYQGDAQDQDRGKDTGLGLDHNHVRRHGDTIKRQDIETLNTL